MLVNLYVIFGLYVKTNVHIGGYIGYVDDQVTFLAEENNILFICNITGKTESTDLSWQVVF